MRPSRGTLSQKNSERVQKAMSAANRFVHVRKLGQSRSSRRFPVECIDLVGANAARGDERIIRSRGEPGMHPHVLQARDALRFPVAHAYPPPRRVVTEGPVEQGFTVRGPGWITAPHVGKLGLLLRLRI